MSKVALDKAVDNIFQDQGLLDLQKSLYCSKDWRSGVTTHSVLLTVEDYLGDLKEWLDSPFYRRAVQACFDVSLSVHVWIVWVI